MISAERLEKLKKLFVEDGIDLTDAEALQVGLWLIARVKLVLRRPPLDKRDLFGTIKKEMTTLKRTTHFRNLYQWRRLRDEKRPPT